MFLFRQMTVFVLGVYAYVLSFCPRAPADDAKQMVFCPHPQLGRDPAFAQEIAGAARTCACLSPLLVGVRVLSYERRFRTSSGGTPTSSRCSPCTIMIFPASRDLRHSHQH